MRRIHLFEFEDQPWFPEILRNYMTDFLQFLSNKSKLWKPIIPVLEQGLKQTQTNTIVDLGSGGGGGLVWLNSELLKTNASLKIVLTDYYPNIPAFQYTKSQASNFEYKTQSVDAKNVPESLIGLRTMFLALHHFKPNEAKQILQNAIDDEQPIAVFEAQERSLPSILAMIFSPLSVGLLTLMIKPFTWRRVLFTYIIPIIPIFVFWDGIVSAFRTYSVKEMEELVGQLKHSETYHWEINRLKSGPGVVLYMLGYKK